MFDQNAITLDELKAEVAENGLRTITVEELQKHNREHDRHWIAIREKVYDITPFLSCKSPWVSKSIYRIIDVVTTYTVKLKFKG